MTAAAIWVLVKKFWWAVPLAGLAIALFFVREDLKSKSAQLDTAKTRVTDLTNANASQAKSLAAVQAQRVDNDAIATAVAAKVGTNTVHETQTRTIIEKAAQNDPVVRNLLDTPLPDSVRQALRADPNGAAPTP